MRDHQVSIKTVTINNFTKNVIIYRVFQKYILLSRNTVS